MAKTNILIYSLAWVLCHLVGRILCNTLVSAQLECFSHQLYREGQEDQLGALGLVITIVVWNTRYIESALQVLQNRSHMIDNDDISRLSSLDHKHINYSRKVFIYSPRRSKKMDNYVH
ncbi:Tn3 family transposase [Bacillus cereus]|nr:Tn3 family transposase [Bacillus cereus]MED3581285.1 Tn3 family transposase [Bacillus thuringiensis]MCU4937136.1 Tn3 family transposase [Bacillus cereus]MCU5457861.1 Tn3 family transposase [Bacillus cereus]MCU5505933.1 Tn3 family transposase [Bacillus cereus]MCU5512350.1 Tn3 family transposase [Bacillus cereus]